MNPTQILTEEKRVQSELLKKKKVDIEKGKTKSEEIRGKLERIQIQYDKLEKLYMEKIETVGKVETLLQTKLKKQEEEKIIMNLGPPSDDIRSFVYVGTRIFNGSYSTPNAEKFKVTNQAKMIENLVRICGNIVKLMNKKSLLKTAQVELTTFEVKNNKTHKDLFKQMKKRAISALSVQFHGLAYTFMVPDDENYTFKSLKKDALIYFELPEKVFALVDQHKRTWPSNAPVFMEMQYAKSKYNLSIEQDADSYVEVFLLEKIKLDYSADIYNLYRKSALDILNQNTENDYMLYSDNLTKKIYKSKAIALETQNGSESNKMMIHQEERKIPKKEPEINLERRGQVLGRSEEINDLDQANDKYLDALYEKHIKNAKSMFIYILLFLSVAFGIYLTEDTADINHTVRMVHSKLFTNNFPIELQNGIGFEEISTIEDIDKWLHYSTTQIFRNIWYNGDPYNNTESNNLFLVNSFIGVGRTLQKKVKDLTCPKYLFPNIMGPVANDNNLQICYPEWTESSESQEPIFISYPPTYNQLIFDAGIVSLYYGLDPAYKETATNNTQRESIFKVLTGAATYKFHTDYTRLIRFMYTQGGFEIVMNKNNTSSIEFSESYEILRKTWFTEKLRLINFNLNFYTPATDVYAAVEVVFEIGVSGTITKVITIQASRVYDYWSSTDYIHMIFEVITLLFVIKMVTRFVNTYYKDGSYAAFSDPFGLIEVMVSILFLLKIVLNVVIFYLPTSVKIKFDSREYIDLTEVLTINSVINMTEGLMITFTALLIFRYFTYSNILWKLLKTLKTSLKLILLYLVIIVIVTMTLALAIHILYGQFMNEFSNLYNTETTILLLVANPFMVLKYLPYEKYITVVLYVFYIVIIRMTLSITFMAIINESYSALSINKDVNTTEEEMGYILEAVWEVIYKLFKFPIKLFSCYFMVQYITGKINEKRGIVQEKKTDNFIKKDFRERQEKKKILEEKRKKKASMNPSTEDMANPDEPEN